MTVPFRFRPAEIICVLIFAAGFLFKYYHFPLGSFALFISGPCAMLYYLNVSRSSGPLYKAYRQGFIHPGFVGGLWLLIVSFILLNQSYINLLFLLASALSLISIYTTFRKKEISLVPTTVFVLGTTLGILFYSLPYHYIYRFMNLHNDGGNTYATGAWNTYSWYLYKDGEYDQALDANRKARDAALRLQKINPDFDSVAIFSQLEDNRDMIIQRSWKTYTELK